MDWEFLWLCPLSDGDTVRSNHRVPLRNVFKLRSQNGAEPLGIIGSINISLTPVHPRSWSVDASR